MLLEVKNLKNYFYTEDGIVPAMDGLSFNLESGETLAIVGESGCGKSVTALSILRIFQSPPGKIVDGQIIYRERDLLTLPEKEMQTIRGNDISMIFQEPLTSLNPVFTISRQICDPLIRHQGKTKKEAAAEAVKLLQKVGIPEAERVINDYPHQFSGGMRQRIMIAMALACNPSILIADEPTTALDVTIQAQILELLCDIKERTNTSIILITHDLGVVAQMAEKVLVMYAGEAVEYADVESIFEHPNHPYTHGLLHSVPVMGVRRDKLYNIKGTIPSASEYCAGCRFAPRCDQADERCFATPAPIIYTGINDYYVRCWKYAKESN